MTEAPKVPYTEPMRSPSIRNHQWCHLLHQEPKGDEVPEIATQPLKETMHNPSIRILNSSIPK